MRICRQCGQPFIPKRPGDKLCGQCAPEQVPFPVPVPELRTHRCIACDAPLPPNVVTYCPDGVCALASRRRVWKGRYPNEPFPASLGGEEA